MKRIQIAALALCVLLLPSACGRTAPSGTTKEPIQTQIAEMSKQAAENEPEESSVTQSLTVPEDASTLWNLPGHIASDVFVRLWDGDVAPGLRAEDAETVKRIIAAQTWGFSYDNLSDVWIESEFVRYAYDTQSGILTESDERAVKLTEAERVQINAILADYLPGYDEENGFAQ